MFRKKKIVANAIIEEKFNAEMIEIKNCFDKNYKIILDRPMLHDHVEMIDWINKNSIGKVSIRLYSAYKMKQGWVISPVGKSRVFIGFENLDDAIVFKLKYLI